jgi:hypothetical protein
MFLASCGSRNPIPAGKIPCTMEESAGRTLNSHVVERVYELARPLTDRELLDMLRPVLDSRSVKPLIEYLASRLGMDEGERELSFSLSGGNLRRTKLDYGPIGNDELDRLAKV